MRGRLVVTVDVAAQEFAGVELRQLLADVGLGVAEHGFHRLVHVDHAAFVVGHHHVGVDVVQGGLDAQVVSGNMMLCLQPQGELCLHLLHPGQQAVLIAGLHRDFVVEAAGGDVFGDADRQCRLSADLAQQRAQNLATQQHQDGQHGQNQPAQYPCVPADAVLRAGLLGAQRGVGKLDRTDDVFTVRLEQGLHFPECLRLGNLVLGGQGGEIRSVRPVVESLADFPGLGHLRLDGVVHGRILPNLVALREIGLRLVEAFFQCRLLPFLHHLHLQGGKVRFHNESRWRQDVRDQILVLHDAGIHGPIHRHGSVGQHTDRGQQDHA